MQKLLKLFPILLFTMVSCGTANHSVKTPHKIEVNEIEVGELEIVKELEVEDLDMGFSVQVGTPKFSAEIVKRSIMIAYVIWAETFGDKDEELKAALHYLVVIWKPAAWEIDSTIFSVDGKKAKHSSVVGLTDSPFVIEVSAAKGRVCETSLVHELVHVFLWHTTSSPDADHEGDKYEGWTKNHTMFIEHTNELLCLLEG